jgi:hypothetical protein
MRAAGEIRGRLVRRPGLFRRWELKDQLGIRPDVHFEEDAVTTDGTVLWAIYDIKDLKETKAPQPTNPGWVALPGVYRAAEFQLPKGTGDWRIDEVGPDSKGEPLYRIHYRLLPILVPPRSPVVPQGGAA